MNPETPNQEERIMAAMAHGSAIVFGVGIIAAVVLWATQKDRSRYVAFHALQALVWQIAGILVQIISWCCWTALYLLSFIPLLAADSSGEPPLLFLGAMALMVVPFALLGLWVLGGLWGAVRALQGRDFRYLVVGPRLERWLSTQ